MIVQDNTGSNIWLTNSGESLVPLMVDVGESNGAPLQIPPTPGSDDHIPE